MSLQFDPEAAAALEAVVPLLAARPKLSVAELPGNRERRNAGMTAFFKHLQDIPEVEQTLYHVEAADGYQIPVHGFTKHDARQSPGPAIVHYHGGGMTVGSVEIYAKHLKRLVRETSIPIFSTDYRLAPEHNGTTPVEDCYAALAWLNQNAQEHNVDPARIAIYGDSAGGGMAAGVALIARDRNLQPPLAKQILVYPMIDDRNLTANPALEPFATWSTEDNILGWTALLGDKAGKANADISPYAAPSRAKNLAGLPPTYIDVGAFDIFRDENISYATRLVAANVETELHLYPGLPHAFEMISPNISQSKRADGNRLRAMMSF
ncbi:hypothetical protein MBLNU459_g7294t1 [Dothideomycetes sp. NU459]